jgi:uncharacterized Fe-S cluster-containing radical SAM superfamily enzyme
MMSHTNFQHGDRVEYKVGDRGWARGTVYTVAVYRVWIMTGDQPGQLVERMLNEVRHVK